MSTLKDLDAQKEHKETQEQRFERYERFAHKRDIEIVREMHGLPPKDPTLSSANNPPVDKGVNR